MKIYFTCALLVILGTSCLAQVARYSKLKVDAKEELTLSSDSTFIDTLILENKAKLKFIRENNFLYVKNAIIGSSCVFNAAGVNGEKGNQFKANGTDASNGKNIYIVLAIKELTELTIDTRGGKGGEGAYGDSGGTRNGGDGGRGGDSGNIELYYSADNQLPTFNRDSKHAIWFKQESGKGGQGGKGAGKTSLAPAGVASSAPADPKVINTRSYYNSSSPELPAGRNGIPGGNGEPAQLKFLRIDVVN